MTPGLDTTTLLTAVGAIYLGLTVTMAMASRQTPSMPGLGRFALAHGLTGLFIGPIVLSIAWQLLAAWIREGTVGMKAAPASKQE